MEQHPLTAFKLTAITVLAAALIGVEDDPVGEDQGAAPAPESGASANSTDPAP